MRKLMALLLIIFTATLFINDAQAKRFGGGRSFGMQRSTSSYSRMQPQHNTSMGQRSPNRWLGPLAGLVTGGLLASLFMGNGLGSGILSWLVIGGIALAVINLLRRKSAPLNTMQYNRPNENPMANNSFNPNHNMTFLNTEAPSGFNADAFLRDAKVQFIRLQAAYDQKNLNDIRQFTTPEVFGEIRLQLQERQDASNQTDVITLEAKLVDAKNEPSLNADQLVASVEFSGQLKENGEQAEAFNEIWHFKNDNQKWIVAGIQQTSI